MAGCMSIAFTVPGEPQGKGRPRVGRVGGQARMFTPSKTAAYEGLIALAAKQAMGPLPLMLGAVAVEVEAVCSVPRSWSKRKQAQALAGEVRPTGKPDADNVLKAVCDGCNGVVFKDDSQAVSVLLRKRYGPTPGLSVRVADLEGTL